MVTNGFEVASKIGLERFFGFATTEHFTAEIRIGNKFLARQPVAALIIERHGAKLIKERTTIAAKHFNGTGHGACH